jgi:hypothetical protein
VRHPKEKNMRSVILAAAALAMLVLSAHAGTVYEIVTFDPLDVICTGAG